MAQNDAPPPPEVSALAQDPAFERMEAAAAAAPEPAEPVRNGRTLEELAERYGAALEKLPESKTWTLSKGSAVVALAEESRVARVDGALVYLDAPLSKRRGKWILGESDERFLAETVFAETKTASRRIRTVVIDPGHGGSENGARNEALGLLEKEMNLDVSQRLQAHLEKRGFKTVLTRYDDRLVELEQRPEIARGAKADLYVSVHFNAASNVEAHGLETFILTPQGKRSSGGNPDEVTDGLPGNRFDGENARLGLLAQKNLTQRLNRLDRGLKKERFKVLRTLECPGVLVECGFLSNQDEALLISTAGYRERVALALAEAITQYAQPPEPTHEPSS